MQIPLSLALVTVLALGAPEDQRVTGVKRGVVKVLAGKKDGTVPGTAVMIGEFRGLTFFLTACHVVAEATSIGVELYEQRGRTVPVSVYDNRCDDRLDLAVLVTSALPSANQVEQIRQIDPATLRVGDRVLVLGHPPDGDWRLRETTLRSITNTHLLVGPDVIRGGDSGGALLSTYGDLIGINVGEDADGERGRAVRIDTALALIDEWKVPYKTHLRVDFCDSIEKITAWSENDFEAIKGAPRKRDYQLTPEWGLREKSMDITGEGNSWLSRESPYTGSDNKTGYIAHFGDYGDERQARTAWRALAERVQQCLPSKEPILKSGGNCLYLQWRKHWLQTPIQFVVYLKPIYSELMLIMKRTYNTPYVCNH